MSTPPVRTNASQARIKSSSALRLYSTSPTRSPTRNGAAVQHDVPTISKLDEGVSKQIETLANSLPPSNIPYSAAQPIAAVTHDSNAPGANEGIISVSAEATNQTEKSDTDVKQGATIPLSDEPARPPSSQFEVRATPSTNHFAESSTHNAYGFPLDYEFVPKEDYVKVQKKYSEVLARREAKWGSAISRLRRSLGSKITDDQVVLPKRSSKMKDLVRGGIPRPLRRIAWLKYSGAEKRMNDNPGLYAALLKREDAAIKIGVIPANDSIDVIERDLLRTFPDNIYFQKLTPIAIPSGVIEKTVGESRNSLVDSLRNVLVAFSFHNAEIGYCQSMNFVVAMLLLHMSEEEAFWMLTVLTETLMPEGMYAKSLQGTVTEMHVFKSIANSKCKKVTKLLRAGGILDLDMLVGPWFLTLYVNVLPTECVLRIWDCLFYEGNKILYRAAIAILKLLEPALSAIKDPLDVVVTIQKRPRSLIDPEALMKRAFQRFGSGSIGSLSHHSIERHRKEHSTRSKPSVSSFSSATTDVPIATSSAYIAPSSRSASIISSVPPTVSSTISLQSDELVSDADDDDCNSISAENKRNSASNGESGEPSIKDDKAFAS